MRRCVRSLPLRFAGLRFEGKPQKLPDKPPEATPGTVPTVGAGFFRGRSQEPAASFMTKPSSDNRASVFWFIWLGMLGTLFMYQFMIGSRAPRGVHPSVADVSTIWYLAGAQVAVATLIRWLLIPRIKRAGEMLTLIKLLGAMILGLLLSEMVEIYGLFLIPGDQSETKLWLFALAVLSMAQFAPTYANRIFGSED